MLFRSGYVRAIEENGLILAVLSSAAYSTGVYKLEPGDRIVMYTDGLVDACNAAGDFFGQDTLSGLLSKSRGLSPAGAADFIISSVRQWSGKQDDDRTVLICDYTPGIEENKTGVHPRCSTSSKLLRD